MPYYCVLLGMSYFHESFQKQLETPPVDGQKLKEGATMALHGILYKYLAQPHRVTSIYVPVSCNVVFIRRCSEHFCFPSQCMTVERLMLWKTEDVVKPSVES